MNRAPRTPHTEYTEDGVPVTYAYVGGYEAYRALVQREADRLRARNEESKKHAENWRQPWTAFELEACMDPDLTIAEIAELSGRTYAGVVNMRNRIRKQRKQHGGDPWEYVDALINEALGEIYAGL